MICFFLKELKVLALSIWCSSLGPNGWWRDTVCTVHFAEKKNQMSQRTMRKTRWAGSTLASAWWSSKESATCPLIWEVGGELLNDFRLCNRYLMIDHHRFLFFSTTNEPLNISHHTTSQISSDLNSEGLAKLLLAVFLK